MKISIYLKNMKISSGKTIPSSVICKGQEFIPEGYKYLRLVQGQSSDKIEGEDVLITGISYGIGQRRYDLSSGYAIEAKLTSKNLLIPKLRKAEGKEIEITHDKNGMPNNVFWPIVVRTWKSKSIIKTIEKNEQIQINNTIDEALELLNEIENENLIYSEEYPDTE